MKLLKRLDILPGWKAAALGLPALLGPFLNDLLPYLGYDPLPDGLMRSGHALLSALWVVAIGLKWRRAKAEG